MSMQTDCIYGFGFKVYVSDEWIKKFILKHEKTIESLGSQGRRLLEYTKECDNESFNPKEDFIDYENILTNDPGIYGVVSDVMFKETGIRFEYYESQDADEDDAIILPQCNPWCFNDKEKNISEEEIENICEKYIKDLGGQLKTDYIRLEYIG